MCHCSYPFQGQNQSIKTYYVHMACIVDHRFSFSIRNGSITELSIATESASELRGRKKRDGQASKDAFNAEEKGSDMLIEYQKRRQKRNETAKKKRKQERRMTSLQRLQTQTREELCRLDRVRVAVEKGWLQRLHYRQERCQARQWNED